MVWWKPLILVLAFVAGIWFGTVLLTRLIALHRSRQLLEAVQKGRLVQASTLVSKGASLEIKDNNGHTPLLIATLNNNRELIEMLLEKGADIAAVNKEGDSPLSIAKKNNYEDILKVLKKFSSYNSIRVI